MVDFIGEWSEKTELPANRMVTWLELGQSKFFEWKKRYGKANEHNAKVPRDHWLLPEEEAAIVAFAKEHPLDGYRRIAFMMIDENIACVSPATVWRVMAKAGLLKRWNNTPSSKGTGFVQPLEPHEHWHIDIAYLNVSGTFYYLCSVLDGCSRLIVHWEIRETMKESEVELVLQRAKEKHPEARPRVISDNGPQFIARDFKEFIRVSGMTHVRTSPYYPQSNGKIERWHKSLKSESIRPSTPLSLEEARRVVERFVGYYNDKRLHSAIGYIAPRARVEGRHHEIQHERDRRLEAAREERARRRALALSA